MPIASPDLTGRQEELLDYIVEYITEKDCQPSLRQMAGAMGIKNVNGVVCHINALELKGFLKRPDKQIARSLAIDWDRYQAKKKGRKSK